MIKEFTEKEKVELAEHVLIHYDNHARLLP